MPEQVTEQKKSWTQNLVNSFIEGRKRLKRKRKKKKKKSTVGGMDYNAIQAERNRREQQKKAINKIFR